MGVSWSYLGYTIMMFAHKYDYPYTTFISVFIENQEKKGLKDLIGFYILIGLNILLNLIKEGILRIIYKYVLVHCF
jgi:hypothetical protein